MSIGAPDYRTYIDSDDWKLRRVGALERSIRRGNYMRAPCCEVCGRTGTSHKNSRSRLDYRERQFRVEYSNGLEVHHLHYRTLGQEEPQDLIVLCTDILHLSGYDIRSRQWHDKMLTTPGEWKDRMKIVGPPPKRPQRVGCHERCHDDREFAIEVERIAWERGW